MKRSRIAPGTKKSEFTSTPDLPTEPFPIFQPFSRRLEGNFPTLTLEEEVALLLRVLPCSQPAWALFFPVLFPTSFDRELIAELWDYVCISKSFFLSWKVSSSKLGFPLHPLSPGVNPPFAGRICLVSTHQNPRDKRKRERGISRGKSVFSVLCLLTLCCRKALFHCIF